MHFLGEGGCFLENSKIQKNKGPGIKVGPINRVKVMKNEIRENTVGIEINSGDPYILNNVIEKNYGNGITTICHDNLRCDGKIRNNEILGNMENGLECCGNTNFCIIENNTIMYNLKAGIRGD